MDDLKAKIAEKGMDKAASWWVKRLNKTDGLDYKQALDFTFEACFTPASMEKAADIVEECGPLFEALLVRSIIIGLGLGPD